MDIPHSLKQIIPIVACVIVSLIPGIAFAGTTVNVNGVEQGGSLQNFAKNASVTTILIDDSKVNDVSQATLTFHSNYPGFTTMQGGSFMGNYNGNFDNRLFVVYDESVSGAQKISTGSMNTFPGDIFSYTWPDAATLFDGTKANVVMTYSNISIPLQTNLGEHVNTRTFTVNNRNVFYNGLSNWQYNPSTGKGEYIGDVQYFIASGNYLRSGNSMTEDALPKVGSSTDYGFTTRSGLVADVRIQVVDDSGNPVDGSFFYPMTDIDISRYTNTNYGRVYDSANNESYSEVISVNSGVEGNIYIPSSSTFLSDVKSNGDAIVFFPTSAQDPDPGTFNSGFASVIDNNQGLSITAYTSGSKSATIRTWLLSGSAFHRIKSSTGTGGVIQTTRGGNVGGTLSDGTDILNSGTYEIADGKDMVYTITPLNDGYSVKTITVDGQTLTLPGVGQSTTVTLDGESGNQRTGILQNVGNGVYTFTFPDNNYNHEIHVDWQAEYYFTKTWIGEEGDSLSITAKAYDEDLSPTGDTKSFTIARNDIVSRSVTSTGTIWTIKLNLPIEKVENHDGDHINPLFWFAEETVPDGYMLTGYNNENIPLLYMLMGEIQKNEELHESIQASTDSAYLSTVAPGGNIENLPIKKVTIEKEVDGSAAKATDSFDFSVSISNLTPNTDYGDFTADSSGNANYSFALKHGESMELSLPYGARIIVTESASDYTAKVRVGDSQPVENHSPYTDISTGEITVDRDITVHFTNELDGEILPETGGAGAYPLYAIGYFLIAFVLAWCLRLRKTLR